MKTGKNNEEYKTVEEYKQTLLEDFKSSPVWVSAISVLLKPFEIDNETFQIEISLKRIKEKEIK